MNDRTNKTSRITAALLLCFSGALLAQQGDYPKVWFAGGNICPNDPWELVFSDDFDQDSLDRQKWTTWYPYGPDGTDQCFFCRTHGEEGQVYRDENAVVENGLLKLVVKPEKQTWFGAERDHSSGMVHTRRNFTDYARYEIRCKIPYGMGFWPAFWVFGAQSEIDIFEFGCQEPEHHYINLHHNGKHRSHDYDGVNFSQGFHLFAAEYEPFFVHIEVDSVRVYSYSRYYTLEGIPVTTCDLAEGPYLQHPIYPRLGDPVQVIANVAVGAAHTPFTKAPNTETVLPNQMDIDFIKVYQHPQPGVPPASLKRLIVYPNPTSSDAVQVRLENFDVPTLVAEGALFDLLDVNRLVRRSQPVEGETTMLSTAGVPPGFYLVRLITRGEAYVVKLIKTT